MASSPGSLDCLEVSSITSLAGLSNLPQFGPLSGLLGLGLFVRKTFGSILDQIKLSGIDGLLGAS